MKYSLRSLMIGIALIAVLLAYVGGYVRRSNRGIYEPAAIGINGVKVYEWAPEGFVEDYEWKLTIWRFYYLLWELDRRFWHEELAGWKSTTYPVDEVPAEDILKVYRAWGELESEENNQKPAVSSAK